MNDLSVKLKDIDISFDNKDVLDIEDLSAYMNDKIAIIEANGSGKSKLLKIIAGKFKEFEGAVQSEAEFKLFCPD